MHTEELLDQYSTPDMTRPSGLPHESAPGHLSAESRRLWRELHRDYEGWDPSDDMHLLVACEALDRLRQAQRDIAAHGLTTEGRFGRKINPAAQVEASSRQAFMASMKALHVGDVKITLSPHDRAAGNRWPR